MKRQATQLEWSRFAQADRDAIFDYIDADSPQAAITVDERIRDQVESLLQFPEMGRPGRIEGTRVFGIRRGLRRAHYATGSHPDHARRPPCFCSSQCDEDRGFLTRNPQIGVVQRTENSYSISTFHTGAPPSEW